jgi:hypothetical protein
MIQFASDGAVANGVSLDDDSTPTLWSLMKENDLLHKIHVQGYYSHLISEHCDNEKTKKKEGSGWCGPVLDLGPGIVPFPAATHFVEPGMFTQPVDRNYGPGEAGLSANGQSVFNLDINYEKIPVPDRHFTFTWSSHCLEDIDAPLMAFNEIVRTSTRGMIMTPSPVAEGSHVVTNSFMRGYAHHRWIFWTDQATNTLYALQKLPLIERIPFLTPMEQSHWRSLLETAIELWNNYYYFDWDDPSKQPKMRLVQWSRDYDLSWVSYSGGYAQVAASLHNPNRASPHSAVNMCPHLLLPLLLSQHIDTFSQILNSHPP